MDVDTFLSYISNGRPAGTRDGPLDNNTLQDSAGVDTDTFLSYLSGGRAAGTGDGLFNGTWPQHVPCVFAQHIDSDSAVNDDALPCLLVVRAPDPYGGRYVSLAYRAAIRPNRQEQRHILAVDGIEVDKYGRPRRDDPLDWRWNSTALSSLRDDVCAPQKPPPYSHGWSKSVRALLTLAWRAVVHDDDGLSLGMRTVRGDQLPDGIGFAGRYYGADDLHHAVFLHPRDTVLLMETVVAQRCRTLDRLKAPSLANAAALSIAHTVGDLESAHSVLDAKSYALVAAHAFRTACRSRDLIAMSKIAHMFGITPTAACRDSNTSGQTAHRVGAESDLRDVAVAVALAIDHRLS